MVGFASLNFINLNYGLNVIKVYHNNMRQGIRFV